MNARVKNLLLAGMLLFGITLPVFSEGFDFGGSQFDVYAPPGYSLSNVDEGLAISNADGDHTILILWGTKADVRGLNDEDALETIVRGLNPSESEYYLVEPFRTVSHDGLSFRVVDLRLDENAVWGIYSLLVRAAITTTAEGNKIVFVGVQRTNASAASFASIEEYRQVFDRVIDRFTPYGKNAVGSTANTARNSAITPEMQKALDADAEKIYKDLFPPDKPALCLFSFDSNLSYPELELKLILRPMRDAAFTLSDVNTDRLVFTGSWENNESTVVSIAFQGSRPTGESSTRSGKSQTRYILPMPPAASPSGDILGRWRAAADGIERERSKFSDDLRTNTTISMTSMMAGLAALAWGLIDCGLKGSADTFNTVLMGAGGGVAAISLTVGLIGEDGLRQRLQNATGQLEQLKKELIGKYPDSFATGK